MSEVEAAMARYTSPDPSYGQDHVQETADDDAHTLAADRLRLEPLLKELIEAREMYRRRELVVRFPEAVLDIIERLAAGPTNEGG